MKFYIRVIGSFRIQEPFALGEVDQVAILIVGDIGVLETDKVFQLFGIGTGEPAGLEKRQGIEYY